MNHLTDMRIHGLIMSNFKIYKKLCPDVCNRIIVWNCSTGCRMMSMWYMLQHNCKINKLTQFLWGFKFQSYCVSWEIEKFIVNMKLQKFRHDFPMNSLLTRIHSSRMHTAHCNCRFSCHACPPAMHAPHHACPLPCMPPAMHALPCHAHPPPQTPPCHACPLPCMPPLPNMSPPPWTEFLTHTCDNITLQQLRCGR